MKVLHISSEITWRGGEQQIAYLVVELNRLGVENTVVCREGSVFEEFCLKNGINHFTLPFKSSYEIKSAKRIKNYCIKNKIDLLHMHSSKGHTIGVLSSLLGNRSKLILSRRVDFPVKSNFLSKWKYNYSKIEKIICVSHKIKEVMTPFIQEKDKLSVVHSGIDLQKFNHTNRGILHQEYGLNEDTKIVANISALADHKDYPTFIRAAKEFFAQQEANVKFMIIGTGELAEPLKQMIQEHGLDKKIIMTGFRNDIPLILPEIDIFLITSKEEGLGTTVLDAFANRIPVVATAGGGIPEMVEDQNTGILCAVGDEKCLANGIHNLLKNKELKQSLTQNAYQKLTDQFTKEKTATQTLSIYQTVLNETK